MSFWRPALPLAAVQALLLAVLALTGCGQQLPSWDSRLSGKITGQYPDYRVSVIARHPIGEGRYLYSTPGVIACAP